MSLLDILENDIKILINETKKKHSNIKDVRIYSIKIHSSNLPNPK